MSTQNFVKMAPPVSIWETSTHCLYGENLEIFSEIFQLNWEKNTKKSQRKLWETICKNLKKNILM